MLRNLALFLILPIATASFSTAQITTAGGGCNPGGRTPGTPVSVGGLSPRIGELNFAIGYTPPTDAVASFWLIGLCDTPPLPNYPGFLCGSPCGRAVSLVSPPILGGANVPPAQVVIPLPLPPVPGLVGVSFCVQYLAFTPSTCSEISQGISIRIMS